MYTCIRKLAKVCDCCACFLLNIGKRRNKFTTFHIQRSTMQVLRNTGRRFIGTQGIKVIKVRISKILTITQQHVGMNIQCQFSQNFTINSNVLLGNNNVLSNHGIKILKKKFISVCISIIKKTLFSKQHKLFYK